MVQLFKYAQLDLPTGVCVSVSYLSGEVDLPHMLLLQPDDDVQPGDIYNDGVWKRNDQIVPPPPPPTPDQLRIEQLELESADLWYDTMLKDARISEHDTDIADLWYTVMTGGV